MKVTNVREKKRAKVALRAHRHLLIHARISKPITTRSAGKRWIIELIERIGMQPLAAPTAAYCNEVGNRGLTVMVPITTSHIAAHFWDELNPALLQLDVYSCGPLNVSIVMDILASLEPTDLKYKFLDRTHGFRVLTTA